jgi:hypothetical protein
MRKLALATAGLIAAAGATVVGTSSAGAADGYFYTYLNAIDADQRTTAWRCRWSGSDGDWRTSPQGRSCDNLATGVWNNGWPSPKYVNDHVRMYDGYSYSGVSMCIRPGDYWLNFALGRERFSDGSNANDRISSHRWVDNCTVR